MGSMEGLVPITRAYLCSYYDKYPLVPLSDDVPALTTHIRSIIGDLKTHTLFSQTILYDRFIRVDTQHIAICPDCDGGFVEGVYAIPLSLISNLDNSRLIHSHSTSSPSSSLSDPNVVVARRK